MINVLPDKAKKELVRERLFRFTIVAGSILFIILFIGTLLLWMPLFVLDLEERELKKKLTILSSAPALARVTEIENDLRLLNDKLDFFEKNNTRIFYASDIIQAILALQISGITLSSFDYDTKGFPREVIPFRIRGDARDRKTLLTFTSGLRGSDLIENVHSPISNLLQDKDIEFLITFDVNLQTIPLINEQR